MCISMSVKVCAEVFVYVCVMRRANTKMASAVRQLWELNMYFLRMCIIIAIRMK